MSHKLNSGIAVIGIDIGKNSFHIVGHDKRGAIVRGEGTCLESAVDRLIPRPKLHRYSITSSTCASKIVTADSDVFTVRMWYSFAEVHL